MTNVKVTTTKNTVTGSDDGSTVTVTICGIAQATYDALVARVAELEATNYLVLEDSP